MNAVVRLNQVNSAFEYVLRDWGGSLILLFLRFHVGWVFFKSGILKVSDWPATLALFHDEYKVPLLPPELAAYLGAFGELTFALLLFVGLLSRPAALALFFVNVMAVISYPQLFQFECPAAINQHFFWGVSLLVLAAFGAGRISLDALLARASKRALGTV
jgi:putative oxidoreductase